MTRPIAISIDGYVVTKCPGCGVVTVEKDGVAIKVLANTRPLNDATVKDFILAAYRPNKESR